MEQMLQKQIDENESQYIWRIGQAKDAGILDLTWGELVPILNRELHIDETEWRGESAFFTQLISFSFIPNPFFTSKTSLKLIGV